MDTLDPGYPRRREGPDVSTLPRMTPEQFEVALDRYDQAISTLTRLPSLAFDDLDDLQRTGAVKRFEYLVEMSWKMCRRYLLLQGSEIGTPKECIRLAAQIGLFADPTRWLHYIQLRNTTAHIYDEDVVRDLLSQLPLFLEDALSLAQNLRTQFSAFQHTDGD